MTNERVLDLYAEWEEALSYPEPNLEIVAGLEAQALNEGIDLREVNYVLVHGLTAAVWNPDLHPRGRDGRFIEVMGLIQLFDFGDGPDGTRGKVKEIRPGRTKGNPDIDVELSDGRTVTVKPNQVATAPEVKADLDFGRRDSGDFIRSVPEIPSSREMQEFEGRTDPTAERLRRMEAYRNRVHQTPEPSYLLETEGLEEAFSTGVPKSVAEGFQRYRLDAESRGEQVLDLDDWVRAGQPGPEAPEVVPEGRPFENLSDSDLQTRYAESVDQLIGDLPEGEMLDVELENTLLREELDRRSIPRRKEDRPFRNLSDDELRDTYQRTVDAAIGDVDEQLVESLGLDAEYLQEEFTARGLDRPRTPASPAEPRAYNESREVGNLMVGDEIILPGDIPGVIEDFEFAENDPGRVTIRTDNGSYQGKTTDILPSFREGTDEGLTPAIAGANTNQIGEEISVEAGEVGSRENPLQTSDVMEAVTALHEGKYVELQSVDQVSTLLDELARIANEAKAAGEDAPNYDLCLVSVPDTNLFCAESKGIPRIQMPQLSGIPVEGSPADALPKNKDGEVDIGPAFAQYLRDKGISVTEKRRPASHLKASQNELVGAKVAGMMKWLEGDTETARNVIRESSIFTTSDDYVVDGHHRWAAVVGLDAAEGGLEDLDMPVQEIDLPILDVLKEANDFATSYGVPPKGAGAGASVGGAPGGAG
jgi:hypothetical protein